MTMIISGRAGGMVAIALMLTLLVSGAWAYAPFPLGTDPAAPYVTASANQSQQVTGYTSLGNGLYYLISTTPADQREAVLGASFDDDWATEPYKTRLLADAVSSYLYLFSPSSVSVLTLTTLPAPRFNHGTGLSSPPGRGTTPNSDTVYSTSYVQLDEGPWELVVPPISGRFYSVTILDIYQNEAYSSGSAYGQFEGLNLLIVGPSTPAEAVNTWKEQQEGYGSTVLGYAGGRPYSQVVEVSTDLALVFLRVLSLSQESPNPDLPNIQAIQSQFKLNPKFTLVPWTNIPTTIPSIPTVQNKTVTPTAYYTWANWVVSTWPGPPGTLTEPISSQLNRFNLLSNQFVFSNLDTDHQQALTTAIAIGSRIIDVNQIWGYDYILPTGWRYNSRTWGVFGSDYLSSAVAAKGFIIPNVGPDSVYVNVFWDSDGNLFSGSNTYSLTLNPASFPIYYNKTGWWSLIAYDQYGVLIPNQKNRWATGDRSAGLEYEDNGDLQLTLAASPPSDPKQYANWVPVAPGAFFLTLRLYSGYKSLIDGQFTLPPVYNNGTAPPFSPSAGSPPAYGGSSPTTTASPIGIASPSTGGSTTDSPPAGGDSGSPPVNPSAGTSPDTSGTVSPTTDGSTSPLTNGSASPATGDIPPATGDVSPATGGTVSPSTDTTVPPPTDTTTTPPPTDTTTSPPGGSILGRRLRALV